MSTPAPPPGNEPPERATGAAPGTGSGQTQPPERKHPGWLWPAIAVFGVLGILAGVIASQNQASSEQPTSTVNSLGLTLQTPASTVTNTVTTETETVTAPAPPPKTVTTTAPAKTTPAPAETTPAPAAPGP